MKIIKLSCRHYLLPRRAYGRMRRKKKEFTSIVEKPIEDRHGMIRQAANVLYGRLKLEVENSLTYKPYSEANVGQVLCPRQCS